MKTKRPLHVRVRKSEVMPEAQTVARATGLRERVRCFVDWGRVIAHNIHPVTHEKYSLHRYHLRPEVEGAIDGIEQLIKMLEIVNAGLPPFRDGLGDVIIIRNGFGPEGEKNQQKFAAKQTHRWMLRHNFYQQTGLSRRQVLYAGTRQGKYHLCRKYRATVIIEDRAEVGMYLHGVRWLAFNPVPAEIRRFAKQVPAEVRDTMLVVRNWRDVLLAVATIYKVGDERTLRIWVDSARFKGRLGLLHKVWDTP